MLSRTSLGLNLTLNNSDHSYRPRSKGDNVLGSVRLSMDTLMAEPFDEVMGQGQKSRSIVWCAAVDIRSSALPSAVKSNKRHYQSKVFVCVSIISWHMLIIARMRSIGF